MDTDKLTLLLVLVAVSLNLYNLMFTRPQAIKIHEKSQAILLQCALLLEQVKEQGALNLEIKKAIISILSEHLKER